MTDQTAFDFTAPAPAVPAPTTAAPAVDGPPALPALTAAAAHRPDGCHARDAQQTRLYRWQFGLFPEADETVLAEDEIRHLVFRVCEDYGVAQVPVIFNARRNRTSVFSGRRIDRNGPAPAMTMYNHEWGCDLAVALEIGAPDWHRRASIVLHEVAHYLMAAHYGYDRGYEDHGPEFATIVTGLFEHYIGGSASEMRREGIAQKIRFA